MTAKSKTFDLADGQPRAHLVEQLRRQLGQWEASTPVSEDIFSSSVPALDQLLAGNPLRYGMLTEWLSGLARSGAATLSLMCAREACRAGGTLVVIDRWQTFYPPAAAAWGIDLNRLIIVRPGSLRDQLWATVQSLRSPAVAAVWTSIDRLSDRAFRQLQLAAQAGRTLGLLLRPVHVRSQPSWADVRLGVEGKMQNAKCKLQNANWQSSAIENLNFAICNLQSQSFSIRRRFQVRILRTRNGRPGGSIVLEIDDAARTIHEVREGSRPSAVGSRQNIRANSPQPRGPSPQSPYDNALSLPVVSKLADPASASLSARA